jgi:hypothetical protein
LGIGVSGGSVDVGGNGDFTIVTKQKQRQDHVKTQEHDQGRKKRRAVSDLIEQHPRAFNRTQRRMSVEGTVPNVGYASVCNKLCWRASRHGVLEDVLGCYLVHNLVVLVLGDP